MAKNKNLTKKQQIALELLTSGEGLTLRQIAERAEINPKTLWRWRHEPEFALFQQELKRINDERWLSAVDAARESCIKLCKDGNQKMIEFVLKNEGYNPTQKVEADIATEFEIVIKK